MKALKIIFICLITTSSIPSVFAQQKDSIEHSIKKGSMSLQFEIGYDFRLTSFDGSQISLKYHISPNIALRFGGGLTSNINNIDVNYDDYYYNQSHISEPLEEYNHEFYLTSAFLWYPKPNSIIKLYFGLGPRASYNYSKDEYLYSDGYKESRWHEGWAAGLNLSAGCEWFPVYFLSLSAEYSFYGVYGENTRTAKTVQYETGLIAERVQEKSKYFLFRGNSARLGLSLYF